MTATDLRSAPTSSSNGSKPTATSPAEDNTAYVRRWLNTWIALGSVVIAVVVAYLYFISNALVSINRDLATASAAVSDAEGNTRTLPGQLAAVNHNLATLDTALSGTRIQTANVRTSLTSIASNLTPTEVSLRSTATDLTHVSTNLRDTVSTLGGVSSDLADTSGLLLQVLHSTGSIETSLSAIDRSSNGGISQITRGLRLVNGSLAGTRSQLGDVNSTLRAVNIELTNICEAKVINLLHGRQPC
jgi:hypothetical protein